MSKPETKQGQSLEEILASIRKALAEEEVQGDADGPAAAEPVRPGDGRPAPEKGDPLSGQLAVALNGTGSRGIAPDDEDLDDLLAPLPSKSASPAPADPEPSAPAGEEKKDPLWFLARKPAPEGAPAPEDATPEAMRTDGAAPSAEKIMLTRPETLRSTLPPLFGTDEGGGVKAEAVSFVQPASAKLKDIPVVPPPEKIKDEKRETKGSVSEKAPLPQAARVDLLAPLPTPPPPSGMLHSAGSVAPAAEAMASALAAPRVGAKGSPAASAQARALEEMIGQLLEPVIRNWLDANLPRLVEKVVHEEVARVSAGKPDASKS